MCFAFLIEKFTKEIVIYIENNDTINTFLKIIEGIKDKKIENINLSEIISNFELNDSIFSPQEISFINENKELLYVDSFIPLLSYKRIHFLLKYLENQKLDIYDCLIVYSIQLYIINEENKNCFFPDSDNFDKKEKAVYLDYNILQRYLEYGKILTNFLFKENLFLVYSPIHAEEVIRTSDSNEKEKAINTINENIENFFFNRKVLYNSDIITKEAFIISIQRAEKSSYGKIADIIKIFEFMNFKGVLLQFKQEIDEYFRRNKIQYGDFNGGKLKVFFEKHPYLRKKLEEYLSIPNNNSNIFNTFLFLDIIGYQLNKEIRGFRSSFYDCLHLEYAEGTRYFITTDKKLAWRAEGIFNFLNIKTGVYLLNENKLKRIKEYSDKDI